MSQPCILIQDSDLYKLKISLSQALYKEKYTQLQISKLLGITQPMVSKYLETKEIPSPFVPKVVEWIHLSNHLEMCTLLTPNPIDRDKHYHLAEKAELLTSERLNVVQNLKEAVELLREKNFGQLVSDVKVNIAQSTPNPKNRQDIAAFPGGILFVNNCLKTYLEPEFNSSHHLADLLLALKTQVGDVNCIMNLKYLPELQKKLRQLKWIFAELDDSYKLPITAVELDSCFHPGSFGIEPTLYILGKNAIEVVEKCQKLIDTIDRN